MDRTWLTRAFRVETLTRGMLAGSIAGALLAVVETVGAMVAGEEPLRPWRMASSVLLGRGAFTTRAEIVILTGLLVHTLISVAAGTTAAMLSEWSRWSRLYRLGPASASGAGAIFGGLLWVLSFPIVAGGLFPWMWRLDQAPQLAFHLGFGAALGLSLHVMGRYARNPPDALRLV